MLPHHNIAYARIPKAANSSVKHALHDFLFGHEATIDGGRRDRFWYQHPSGLADMMSYGALKQKHPDAFIFSFVRNPYSQTVSCYHEKIVKRRKYGLINSFRDSGFTPEMTFRDFVDHIATIPDEVADVHFKSQASMLTVKGKSTCDFIGKTETMDKDWAHLQATISGKSGHHLPNIRTIHQQADRPKPRDLYNDYLITKVRERYDNDFRLFYPTDITP
ncbi:hypothetical protein GCM10017044_00900 [Kordiimonas sediminis]|uniref:Sulfotransferase family protein n=1 Tax=Kordiimonas sediminis TaxID=1735581 RepID=A0A919AJ13_9PROT|nr:hypothetical protein GCM10017044_00900 [Kordiimonas sediminis]